VLNEGLSAVSGLHDDAVAVAAEVTELRHAIHQDPEIGTDLPRTQEKVLAALAGLPVEVTPGKSLTSVTAVLRGARPGPTVLLRGDMDALPVTERTGVPYTSRVPGVMHACGHDLHTAMLAGSVKLLAARRDELAGNVVFMFQPGEEGYHGARFMIEEGVLDAAGERPVAAYALHVSSNRLPAGHFSTRGGTMMAAADTLQVTVRGRGGHASRPSDSADPIPAACEMVTALQTLVTRKFDVFDPIVITVGSFHAGTADNIIPDQATFAATVRSFSPVARDRVTAASVALLRGIADAHGLAVDAEYVPGYPVTINNGAEVGFAEGVAGEAFGPDRFSIAESPLTGAEDFSYVLEQAHGAFIMLGACPPGTEPMTAPSNHSAEAIFDDCVLADGTAMYAELALRRLSRA
jgi:hippurate hydrolase